MATLPASGSEIWKSSCVGIGSGAGTAHLVQTPTKLLLGLGHRLIVSCNMSRMRQVCLQISLFAYVFDVNVTLCGSDPLGAVRRGVLKLAYTENASGRVEL